MNASKVAEHKVSTQKSVAFLYINSEQSGKEIAKAIWFAERLNRIKYLGINQGGERFVQWKLQNIAERNYRWHN